MLYILLRLPASLRSMPVWDNYSSLNGSFNRQPATEVVSNEEGRRRRRRRPSSQFNLVAASSFSSVGRIVIYISKKAPERLNLTIDRHLRLRRRRLNVTILRAVNKSRLAHLPMRIRIKTFDTFLRSPSLRARSLGRFFRFREKFYDFYCRKCNERSELLVRRPRRVSRRVIPWPRELPFKLRVLKTIYINKYRGVIRRYHVKLSAFHLFVFR